MLEESKLALEFQPDLCSWQLLEGPAEDYELADTRRTIVRLLRENEGLTPKEVADRTGLEPATAASDPASDGGRRPTRHGRVGALLPDTPVTCHICHRRH